MPNAAQVETYKFIRSEIARLRGPQSYLPLSLDQVTPLADNGEDAIFCVSGARVFVKGSGKVVDAGLPDCPRYASGLLPGRFLPAIAADLLRPGNPHKAALGNHSHTPKSFEAYLQRGTPLGQGTAPCIHQPKAAASVGVKDSDPYNFVLQFAASEIDELVARRLTNVEEEKAFKAGSSIAGGNYSRENLKVIVDWKIEDRYLTRVMSYLDQNTDADIANALRSALSADSEKSAIASLDRLHGVGVPVASAILTTTNPGRYTIIDVNALKSLGIEDAPTDNVDYYLAYLRKCRELAEQLKRSLRTLDHALWQWGHEN